MTPKALRVNRKYAKDLNDLNQRVKMIYSRYIILENGFIIGIPIMNSEKKIKEKYLHAYYRTNILNLHPDLVNVSFYPQAIFEYFRDYKPDYLEIENDNLMIWDTSSKDIQPICGGKKINDNMLVNANNTLSKVGNEIAEIIKADDVISLEFSPEDIKGMIDYKKISPCFLGDESMTMYLAISEFPLLKKFKHITAYSREIFRTKEYFDVVFNTYNGNDKFLIKRRFLRV